MGSHSARDRATAAKATDSCESVTAEGRGVAQQASAADVSRRREPSAAPFAANRAQSGQTIHVWFEYIYYDGLWSFFKGCKTGPWPVWWCDEALGEVGVTSNG